MGEYEILKKKILELSRTIDSQNDALNLAAKEYSHAARCYEYGRREPRLSNLIKLSKIFDIPVDVLCSPYPVDMTIDNCSDFISSIDGCGIKRMTDNSNDYLVTIPYSPEYHLNLVMPSEDVISMCQSVNGSKTAFVRAFKNRYLLCAAKYASTNRVIYW